MVRQSALHIVTSSPYSAEVFFNPLPHPSKLVFFNLWPTDPWESADCLRGL